MAGATEWAPNQDSRPAMRSASHLADRPLPLRTYSEGGSEIPEPPIINHARRRSAYTTAGRRRLNLRRPTERNSVDFTLATRIHPDEIIAEKTLSAVSELGEDGCEHSPEDVATLSISTPPLFPMKGSGNGCDYDSQPEIAIYDFTKIDYELDRAWSIGKGLWSSVYLAQPVAKALVRSKADVPTPSSTPQSKTVKSSCRLFAVKMPARAEAKDIFRQEARILTKLQQSENAHEYIVSFQGLDIRNSSLILEGVIGGSLEQLVCRLKVMTELERHLELRSLFFRLAYDLVSGLRFIHGARVVHADIKPANVLLDVADHYSLAGPVIRARYIDFSASFISGLDSASNAGGTWDFMAPEQLRIQKGANAPTCASDVWSLGLTLLFVLVGGSPYTAACGHNVFMLREAIKCGDPLGFARMDAVVQKRMSACQDFVDVCRLALQKDRDPRASAAAWQRWLEDNYVED